VHVSGGYTDDVDLCILYMASGVVWALGILLMAVGAAMAYFGWRIHEALVALLGAILGFAIGLIVSIGIIPNPQAVPMSDTVQVIVVGVLTIAGIGTAQIAERLFVVLQGVIVGIYIGLLVLPVVLLAGFMFHIPGVSCPAGSGGIGAVLGCLTSPVALLVVLPAAIAGGWLAWKFFVYGIILATAFYGAVFLAGGVVVIGAGDVAVPAAFATFLTGLLVQSLTVGDELTVPEESSAAPDTAAPESAAGAERDGRPGESNATSLAEVRRFARGALPAVVLLAVVAAWSVAVVLGTPLPENGRWLLLFGGSVLVAAVNLVVGGRLASSILVGTVPIVWIPVDRYLRLQTGVGITRDQMYRFSETSGLPGLGYYLPVETIGLALIVGVTGAGLGTAVALGYNRFVGSTSDGAAAD
jgi:hypothetical protein